MVRKAVSYSDLKVGDEVWVRATVTSVFKPGELGYKNGWAGIRIVRDPSLGSQEPLTVDARSVRKE